MSSRETTIPRPKFRDHQRISSLAVYNANPNICGECGKKIEVGEHQKVAIVRKWKHCSLKCSATARWKRERAISGKEKHVRGAYMSTVPFCKKGEVRSEQIRAHGKKVFRVLGIDFCERCGYRVTKPDVAHIKAISSFAETSTLLQVNHRSNLVGLCKNCHNEFDLGLIPEQEIKTIVASRGGS